MAWAARVGAPEESRQERLAGGCRGRAPSRWSGRERVDRPFEALAQAGARAKAKLVLGAGGVQPAARLAVGLGGVPDDLAGEADELRDQLGQARDRDLLAGAEVDRIGAG